MLPWFLMRNLLSFKSFFPYRQGIISLWLLFNIFSVFISKKFNYNVLWHVFLWIYSVIHLGSWICMFTSLAKFEKISAIISLSTFSAPLSLLSPSKTLMTGMSAFCKSPTSLSVSSYSLLSRMGNFYFPISSSPILSSVLFTDFWAHPLSFLFCFGFFVLFFTLVTVFFSF